MRVWAIADERIVVEWPRIRFWRSPTWLITAWVNFEIPAFLSYLCSYLNKGFHCIINIKIENEIRGFRGLTVRSSHPIIAFPYPLEHHRFKGAQSDTVFGFAISLLGFFYIVTYFFSFFVWSMGFPWKPRTWDYSGTFKNYLPCLK